MSKVLYKRERISAAASSRLCAPTDTSPKRNADQARQESNRGKDWNRKIFKHGHTTGIVLQVFGFYRFSILKSREGTTKKHVRIDCLFGGRIFLHKV